MLGMSTACFFARMNVEDTFLEMQKMGCSLCEVFLNTFCEYEKEFTKTLASKARDAGITVYAVHAMSTQFEPQLFSLNPRQQHDAESIFTQVLKCGQRLGAKVYVMHGPMMLRGAVRDINFASLGKVTARLCSIAQDHGIILAWENVSWCLFCEPVFAPRILDATNGHENLRFTLDIKQAARSGFSVDEYILAMGDRIANLHLCDYIIKPQTVRPAMLGEGSADLDALKARLDQAGYKGPALVEIYSDLYGGIDELAASYKKYSGVF